MKIGVKLIAGFLVVVVILALVAGATTIFSLRASNAQHTMMKKYADLQSLNALSTSLQQELGQESKALVFDNRALAPISLNQAATLHQKNLALFDSLNKIFAANTGYLNALKFVRTSYDMSYALFAPEIPRILDGQDVSAGVGSSMTTLINSSVVGNDQIGLIYVINQVTAEVQVAQNAAQTALDTAISVTIGAVVIAIILSITLGLLISRSITRPIRQLTAAADKISGGDLNTPIPNIQTKDEIQSLAMAMSILSETVNSSVNALRESESSS